MENGLDHVVEELLWPKQRKRGGRSGSGVSGAKGESFQEGLSLNGLEGGFLGLRSR